MFNIFNKVLVGALLVALATSGFYYIKFQRQLKVVESLETRLAVKETIITTLEANIETAKVEKEANAEAARILAEANEELRVQLQESADIQIAVVEQDDEKLAAIPGSLGDALRVLEQHRGDSCDQGAPRGTADPAVAPDGMLKF